MVVWADRLLGCSRHCPSRRRIPYRDPSHQCARRVIPRGIPWEVPWGLQGSLHGFFKQRRSHHSGQRWYVHSCSNSGDILARHLHRWRTYHADGEEQRSIRTFKLGAAHVAVADRLQGIVTWHLRTGQNSYRWYFIFHHDILVYAGLAK